MSCSACSRACRRRHHLWVTVNMSATFFSGLRTAGALHSRRFLVQPAVLLVALAGESAFAAEPTRAQCNLTEPATLMRVLPTATVKPRLFVGTAFETPSRDDAAWNSTTRSASVAASTPRSNQFAPSYSKAKPSGISRPLPAISPRSQWVSTHSHSLTAATPKAASQALATLQSLGQPAAHSAFVTTPTDRMPNGIARVMPALLGPPSHAAGVVDRSVFASQATFTPVSFSTVGGASSFTSGMPQQPWSSTPMR